MSDILSIYTNCSLVTWRLDIKKGFDCQSGFGEDLIKFRTYDGHTDTKAVARTSFLAQRVLKYLPKMKSGLISNKDDLALKTLTRILVYTNKYACLGSIW